jgi:hypothetical protein
LILGPLCTVDVDWMANDPPRVADPAAEHPLAVWLHRVADNLNAIYVRDREADDQPWKTVALGTLPHPVAAAYVADFLQRWPGTASVCPGESEQFGLAMTSTQSNRTRFQAAPPVA